MTPPTIITTDGARQAVSKQTRRDKVKAKKNQDDFGTLTPDSGETSQESLARSGGYPIVGFSAQQKTKLTKIIYSAMIGLLFLSPVISISGAAISATNKNVAMKAADIAYRPQFTARYPDLGREIIRAYFAGDNPPVNLGESVQWPTSETGGDAPVVSGTPVTNITLINASQQDFSSPEAGSRGYSSNFPNPKEEILTYLATINGRHYTVAVTLVIPDLDNIERLPYLIAPPTIQPMEVLTRTTGRLSEPTGEGYKDLKLTDAMLATIAQWADAYAQGDATTLKRLSGDTTDNIYRGLGGFRLQGAPVAIWAYTINDNPGHAFVRISFDMEQKAYREDTSSQGGFESTFVAHQQMDILMKTDSSVPHVQAWGPTGSWFYLYPTYNAYQQHNLTHSPMESIQPGDAIPGTENSGEVVTTGTNESREEERIENSIKNDPGKAAPTIVRKKE